MCRELPFSQLKSSRDLLDQTGAIGGREKDRLGVPVAEGAGPIAVGGGRVLFEHGVGVDSGEAERIDARPARRLFDRHESRGGRPDSERTRLVAIVEQRVRFVGVQGRRQDAVIKRQCRLDQSGHAGRRHGMADHR